MTFTPADISSHADDILRAAGSRLSNYQTRSKGDILKAVHAALESAYGKGVADAHKAMDAVHHLRGG